MVQDICVLKSLAKNFSIYSDDDDDIDAEGRMTFIAFPFLQVGAKRSENIVISKNRK